MSCSEGCNRGLLGSRLRQMGGGNRQSGWPLKLSEAELGGAGNGDTAADDEHHGGDVADMSLDRAHRCTTAASWTDGVACHEQTQYLQLTLSPSDVITFT